MIIMSLIFRWCAVIERIWIMKSDFDSTTSLVTWKWKLLSCVQLFATPWTDYTVHGILQARILEWVTFPFSRGSSQPRDWTQVSCIVGGFFISWATREAQEYWSESPIPSPGDPSDTGIELGSPALHVDSLPAELPEKLFHPLHHQGSPCLYC